jgi:hypothetical protein
MTLTQIASAAVNVLFPPALRPGVTVTVYSHNTALGWEAYPGWVMAVYDNDRALVTFERWGRMETCGVDVDLLSVQ